VTSEYTELLTELLQQEEEIQFSGFNNDMAFAVGTALLDAARSKGKAVTIDIARNGQQLFHYAMQGTTRDNDVWVQRKNSEYAAHGGAFPLIIRDVGVVGTITVSGLPQEEDHELVVITLRKFLAEGKQRFAQ